MLLTFGEAKTGPISRVAGVCVDSDDFRNYLNDATRQLMRRGSWWGTLQPIQGCVYGNCVTWPRQVESVMALNQGGKFSTPQNRWFRFMHWDDETVNWARGSCGNRENTRAINVSEETSPVFNQLASDKFITAYVDNLADVGKTITIFGIDSSGQTIFTKRPDGLIKEGLVLTFANPYVTSTIKVRRVDRVLKDVTQGKVRIYGNDGAGTLSDLATYDGSETSPDYVVTKFFGSQCSRITALVKLAFVPVTNDDDLVLIENQDALRDMVQSIRYKEQGNLGEAVAFERLAIRELNYELRSRFPDYQTPVNWRPFGVQGARNMIIR